MHIVCFEDRIIIWKGAGRFSRGTLHRHALKLVDNQQFQPIIEETDVPNPPNPPHNANADDVESSKKNKGNDNRNRHGGENGIVPSSGRDELSQSRSGVRGEKHDS